MSAFVKSRKIAFLAVLTLLLALCLPVGGVAEEAAPVFELPPARGAVDMSGLESYMVPEADTSFQLPAEHEQSQAESASPVLDKALGVIGLPGMAAKSDDESTYEKAWRMPDSPNGGTRLTYGERYRRNPDGSYGAQSSSQWSGVNNISERLLEQALSAGSGYFSSWAEGWLGGYGKARISVRVNDEGDVTGSGDFLYPIYDSESTTFFTQIGLRTMANDRVIGNFGLGQRFFPAENFALGYNVFLDQDFSRNHTRGGAGVEAWYDWVRLSANYYTPLSGWKDSEDYDSRLVEERPAEGYDARLTGYLPFYRNLAVTGAFEQWKGDHVGSFGSDDVVQKDPKVWSYGLEWTPVPAFSTSVNQRHSGGQKETQFGLTFNYHFGMDWEDQLSPAMVTEMRTVDGSRHDFVNRQNEMILAYRAKEGAYNIVLWNTLGRNVFEFRLTNGFGEPVAGQAVQVSAAQNVTVGSGGVFVTDGDGVIRVTLTDVPGAVSLPLLVTLTAGRTTQTIALNSEVTATDVYTLVPSPASLKLNTAADVTFTLYNNGVQVSEVTPVYFTTNTIYGNTLPASASTDASGVFTINNLTANTLGDATIEATVNGETVTCLITVGSVYKLTVTTGFATVPFVTGSSADDFKSTATLTATLTKDGVALTAAELDAIGVTWSVLESKNSGINPAAGATTWWKPRLDSLGSNTFNTFGLSWGTDAVTPPENDTLRTTQTAPNGAEAKLTDIVGSRPVTVTAGVCIGGAGADETTCVGDSGAWYSDDQDVTFGAGPLSVFKTDPNDGIGKKWAVKYGAGAPSNTVGGDFATNASTEFEAAYAVGGSVNASGFTYSGTSWGSYQVTAWPSSFDVATGETAADGYYSAGHFVKSSQLPTISQLRAVAKNSGNGAAFAANWPDSQYGGYYYWSGEVAFFGVNGYFLARIVVLENGDVGWYRVGYVDPVAVGVGP